MAVYIMTHSKEMRIMSVMQWPIFMPWWRGPKNFKAIKLLHFWTLKTFNDPYFNDENIRILPTQLTESKYYLYSLYYKMSGWYFVRRRNVYSACICGGYMRWLIQLHRKQKLSVIYKQLASLTRCSGGFNLFIYFFCFDPLANKQIYKHI